MPAPRPNYTQLPNILLDNMASFSDAELRVVLCVGRLTFGWHQSETERLTIQQIRAHTGMSHQGVINALHGRTGGPDGLIGRGIVERELVGEKQYVYWLVVQDDTVNGVDDGGGKTQSTALTVSVNGVDRNGQNTVNGVDRETSPHIKGNKGLKEKAKENSLLAVAEQLYELYPRNIARKDGIRAILKALEKEDVEKLFDATRSFAAAWKNAPADEIQYCPYAQKWFNQERYNDDPSTWERRSSRQPELVDHSKGF